MGEIEKTAGRIERALTRAAASSASRETRTAHTRDVSQYLGHLTRTGERPVAPPCPRSTISSPG